MVRLCHLSVENMCVIASASASQHSNSCDVPLCPLQVTDEPHRGLFSASVFLYPSPASSLCIVSLLSSLRSSLKARHPHIYASLNLFPPGLPLPSHGYHSRLKVSHMEFWIVSIYPSPGLPFFLHFLCLSPSSSVVLMRGLEPPARSTPPPVLV